MFYKKISSVKLTQVKVEKNNSSENKNLIIAQTFKGSLQSLDWNEWWNGTMEPPLLCLQVKDHIQRG